MFKIRYSIFFFSFSRQRYIPLNNPQLPCRGRDKVRIRANNSLSLGEGSGEAAKQHSKKVVIAIKLTLEKYYINTAMHNGV